MTGTTLGPYRVLEKLGAGGMGEVYRARDTSLNRDVALKVLPDALAGDTDRLARFQREAEALAALNHPNIAAIYGIEGGRSPASIGETRPAVRAIVMELVEGRDLSEVIARGYPEAESVSSRLRDSDSAARLGGGAARGLNIEDAVSIARQIAEALEAAHERGIIHRDLKPANIKVRDDGTVKVLDFGLAKAVDGDGSGSRQQDPSPSLMNSPTMTSPAMTREGVILGTAAYMAPEQAKGRVVDKRADVWAFGVVFYEMLAGRGLFHGDTLVETLAQVMTHEPPLDALPATVPPAIRQLLARCLERDPKLRLRDIGEARILLASPEALAPPVRSSAANEATATSSWRPIHLVAIAGTLALGLVAGAAWFNPATSMAGGVTRFPIELASGTHLGPGGDYSRPTFRQFALSPDGRHLVYVGQNDTDGNIQLYLRHMDQEESTPLPGTEGGGFPIFSPDSVDVAFLQGTAGGPPRLRRMSIDGGPARTIAEAGPDLPILVPASWSDEDEILFTSNRGVFAVPAAGGGEPRQLTTREGGSRHMFPQMLPGGQAVLYNLARGSVPSRWDVVVENVDSDERQVVASGSHPTYVASGHVLFVRTGKLMAVAFDPTTLRQGGSPVVVLEDVMQTERGGNDANRSGSSQYAVSQTGALAYVPGGVLPVALNPVGWKARDGTFTEIPVPPAQIWYPSLSPDDARLAWVSGVDDRTIWMLDFREGSPRKLTEDVGFRSTPIWSPDGTQLVYQVEVAGQYWLELLTVDVSGPPERIELDAVMLPASWPSSNILALLGPGHRRIWTMPMDGSNAPRTFVETAGDNLHFPTFSPDGKWLAYSSTENGREDVYVRPYPDGDPVVVVSPSGGTAPAWSRDGTELFYRQGNQLVSVGVTTEDGFRRNGAPRPLFDYGGSTFPLRNFDVAADGGFVMPGPRESIPPQPVTRINLVLNWFEELTRLAPGR